MVHLYAPADTEEVPILRKSERRQKKIFSYIFLSIGILASLVINSNEFSNILILGNLLQSASISRFAYKLTKNKYGHEVYNEESINI